MSGPATAVSLDELNDIFESVRNWDRWGPDDQRGTLNLITDETRRRAASLPREGISVSAALPLATTPAPNNPNPVMHMMARAGDIEGVTAALDYFAIASHGRANTHMDALCHFFYRGQMYNGRPSTDVLSTGALANDITQMGDGVISRGILLDVPSLSDRGWLEPGEAIYQQDLEQAEAAAGVVVENGDILLVRTGRHHRQHPKEAGAGTEPIAGLHASCLPWLHRRGISVLGCDGISDVTPSGLEGGGLPVHSVVIPGMGVHLIDNCDLESLSETCQRLKRWEFQMVLAPLKLRGGTGSPVNPIAFF